MKNLKNIVKHSFRLLLIVVLSTVATDVASAKTINQSNTIIDDTRLDYFINMYERSDFKNYLIASEYSYSGYNSYTDYYICLTNEPVTINSGISASANCDELYRYNYHNSTDNTLEKITNTNLSVNNSVYYVNSVTKHTKEKLLFLVNVGVFSIFLVLVLFKIFRG